MAMGSNSDRDELEEQARKLEEEVDDAEKTLNEVYITLCQARKQQILNTSFSLHFTTEICSDIVGTLAQL